MLTWSRWVCRAGRCKCWPREDASRQQAWNIFGILLCSDVDPHGLNADMDQDLQKMNVDPDPGQ